MKKTVGNMKEIIWNGHTIIYDPNNLIPLLARVAQITREESVNIFEDSDADFAPLNI